MIRVFGLILTEYLDRFQPSIWTDFDRVFGSILTEYLDRFRPSIWILNFSFPAAVTNTLSPARQYFLIFRREAMSTVFGTIHFLEIILLLPVPETSAAARHRFMWEISVRLCRKSPILYWADLRIWCGIGMPDFLHCIDLTDLFCSDAVNFQALKLFWQVALTPSGYMIDSTGILAMDLAGLHGCGHQFPGTG